MNKVTLGLLAAPIALSLSAGAAMAQDRPDGIRAGAFYLVPSLNTAVFYDDNLFHEQGNAADSDVVFHIAPNLIARTARRVHLVEVDLGAQADFHSENSRDDSVDAHARIRGRYDISRRTNVSAGVGYERGHDDRGSDLAANQAEPTFRNVYNARAAFSTRPNRMRIRVGADVAYEDYEDADANNNDDDRDVVIYGFNARVGYEARKGYTVFVRGRYDVRDFSDAVDDVGIQRGSTGYSIRAGIQYQPSAKLTASASAGYLSRSYDERTFGDVDGVDLNASLDWELPGRNTNVIFSLGRTIAETTDADAAGRLTTTADLAITQKIRRAIELTAKAGYMNQTEEGNVGNRDDDTYRAGLVADYKFHRYVKAGAFYSYERRVSNEAGAGHVNNVVGVRLLVGF